MKQIDKQIDKLIDIGTSIWYQHAQMQRRRYTPAHVTEKTIYHQYIHIGRQVSHPSPSSLLTHPPGSPIPLKFAHPSLSLTRLPFHLGPLGAQGVGLGKGHGERGAPGTVRSTSNRSLSSGGEVLTALNRAIPRIELTAAAVCKRFVLTFPSRFCTQWASSHTAHTDTVQNGMRGTPRSKSFRTCLICSQ